MLPARKRRQEFRLTTDAKHWKKGQSSNAEVNFRSELPCARSASKTPVRKLMLQHQGFQDIRDLKHRSVVECFYARAQTLDPLAAEHRRDCAADLAKRRQH